MKEKIPHFIIQISITLSTCMCNAQGIVILALELSYSLFNQEEYICRGKVLSQLKKTSAVCGGLRSKK